MHATDAQFIAKIHDGDIPTAWSTGSTEHAKAKFLATVAWAQVKAAEDPQLPSCDLTHQQNCIGLAEDILRGNGPDNSPLSQRIYQLYKEVTSHEPNGTERSSREGLELDEGQSGPEV